LQETLNILLLYRRINFFGLKKKSRAGGTVASFVELRHQKLANLIIRDRVGDDDEIDTEVFAYILLDVIPVLLVLKLVARIIVHHPIKVVMLRAIVFDGETELFIVHVELQRTVGDGIRQKLGTDLLKRFLEIKFEEPFTLRLSFGGAWLRWWSHAQCRRRRGGHHPELLHEIIHGDIRTALHPYPSPQAPQDKERDDGRRKDATPAVHPPEFLDPLKYHVY
jgi:hypothetical protein